MNKKKKHQITSNKIVHNLRYQCMHASNSLDCMLLAYLCVTQDIKFDKDKTIKYMSLTASKSNKCRYNIITSKLQNLNLLSSIDIKQALETSNLLHSIISSTANSIYALIAVSQHEKPQKDSYAFVEMCVVATKMCTAIADQIIDGSDEIFTSHKIKKIQNMIDRVKDIFLNVHREYSSALSNLYALYLNNRDHAVIFHGWSDIYKCQFNAFSNAFLIAIKTAVTIKHL